MKKDYLKPEVERIALEAEENIMDQVIIPSWEIGEDDEEGI